MYTDPGARHGREVGVRGGEETRICGGLERGEDVGSWSGGKDYGVHDDGGRGECGRGDEYGECHVGFFSFFLSILLFFLDGSLGRFFFFFLLSFCVCSRCCFGLIIDIEILGSRRQEKMIMVI